MARTRILVDFKEQNQPRAPVFYSCPTKIHSFCLHVSAALVILSRSLPSPAEVTALCDTTHHNAPVTTALSQAEPQEEGGTELTEYLHTNILAMKTLGKETHKKASDSLMRFW